jgi:pimeloyl-ACP methyl ester carboxylesterase
MLTVSTSPASKLPPLVLLPGLLCDAQLWRHQAESLSDVAAPFIADLTRDDSIAAMAARVLAEAPAHFALAALSMGGYVALEVMRQAPERVTRLALFDTSARPDTPERAARRRADIEAVEHGRFAGVTPRLLPELIHPSRAAGPVGEAVMAMARRVGKAAFLRQQRAILGRADARPGLSHIRVPTLVAVGEDDVRTPVAIAEEIHRAIPHATLYVFWDCGHLPPLELPEETTQVLRAWLTAP